MRALLRLLAPLLLLLAACATSPYTQRSQLLLLDIGTETRLGADSYQEELGKVKKSNDPRLNAMVQRVGMAIARAASADPIVREYCPDVAQFAWEVHLIENKLVNANCRPGGKMIVYTGILPLTRTEAGLAVVLGHEVAHAVCRHGNERLSQGLIAQLGMAAVDAALSEGNEEVRTGVAAALGAGVGVGVLLPYSRMHEIEADRVGLILMAKAGYNPREAPAFWGRMAKVGGQGGPEWLSTHPAHETRIRQLQKWMPEALSHYRPAGR